MSRQFDVQFWEKYKTYLTTISNNDTSNDRIAYARKYYHILTSGNATELLALSNDKRIHIMKSLAALSKYTGCYDKWMEIRNKYQLRWSNNDPLHEFNRIFNNEENYSFMLDWVRTSIKSLPQSYANVLVYCTLTGLRPDEAFKSLQLLQKDKQNYLNTKTMVLEHYKYPHIFIRRTKKAYVSIATDDILKIANETKCSSYNSLNMFSKRNSLPMRMSYCRKIYATYLRMKGIESETIDLFQGRIPKSVFARHYFKPDSGYQKVREVLHDLFSKQLKP